MNVVLLLLGLASLCILCGLGAKTYAVKRGYENPHYWFWYGLVPFVFIIAAIAAHNKKTKGSVFKIEI